MERLPLALYLSAYSSIALGVHVYLLYTQTETHHTEHLYLLQRN